MGVFVGVSVLFNVINMILNFGLIVLIGVLDNNGMFEIFVCDIENCDDVIVIDLMVMIVIFGMGKVVLVGGKDVSGNYMNVGFVNNVLVLIQFGSDMKLYVDKVMSMCCVMKMFISQIDLVLFVQFGISMFGCVVVYMEVCVGWDVGGVDFCDFVVCEFFLDFVGGVLIDLLYGGQWNSNYQKMIYYVDSVMVMIVMDISLVVQIVLGGKIDVFLVGMLQNYWSNIVVVGDIDMLVYYDVDGWVVFGQKLLGVMVLYLG